MSTDGEITPIMPARSLDDVFGGLDGDIEGLDVGCVRLDGAIGDFDAAFVRFDGAIGGHHPFTRYWPVGWVS